VSWSLTPSAEDTADLFREQIRVQHSEAGEVTYQYLHSRGASTSGGESSGESSGEGDGSDEWRPAVLRRETITVRPVKRQTSSSEITLDCLETPRGVVLPTDSLTSFSAQAMHRQQQRYRQQQERYPDQEQEQAPFSHYSLASVDRRHPLHLSHWLLLNSAHSWTDFNAALQDMHALSWNALYADTSNNIGSRVTGR
jgi:acyl-homoserine lactone acylase PvdQ